jgi:hypothetical protein
MNIPSLSPILAWWRGPARMRIRKGVAKLRSVWPHITLTAGWGFLTWSMFLWNIRAWGASIGVYLFLNGIMPVVAVFIESRTQARRRSHDK